MNTSELSSKRNFSMKLSLIFWGKKPNCLASQQSQLLNCVFWINSMLCVYYNYVYNYNICVILQPTEKTLDQLPMPTGLTFKPFPRVLRALCEVALTTSVNSILHHGPWLLSVAPCLTWGPFELSACSYFPRVVFAACFYKNTLASDTCMTGTSITTAGRLSLICFLFFVVLLVNHDPVYLWICSLSLLRECNLHVRKHFIYLMCQCIAKA